MNERIVLDNLNQDSVSLLKIATVEVNGQQIEASRWRRAYINSTQGRASVQAEIAEPYLTVILAVWGATPTVSDTAQ